MLSALAAVAMLTSLVACTDEPTTLDFSAAPIVTGADFSAPDLTGTTILDHIALVRTTGPSGGTLAANDLTTGRTLWSADDGDPALDANGMRADLRTSSEALPPVVRETRNGGAEVLVPFRSVESLTALTDADIHYGVMGLDVETGHANWVSEDLVTASRQDRTVAVRPVRANAEVVLAAAVSAQVPTPTGPTTSAIDPTDGSVLWSEKGRWPAGLGGGVVALADSVDPQASIEAAEPRLKETTQVRAVDQVSGKPVWDLDERFDAARITGQASGIAVVEGFASKGEASDSPTIRTEAIRLDTGEQVEDLGGDTDCASSALMIACAGTSDGATGQDTGEGQSNDAGQGTTATLTTIRPDADPDEAGMIDDGADGVADPIREDSTPFKQDQLWQLRSVFGTTVIASTEVDGKDRTAALGPKGTFRSEDLGFEPRVMTEDYAIGCSDDRTECEIHPAPGVTGPTDKAAATSAPASLPPLTVGQPLWAYGAKPLSGLKDIAEQEPMLSTTVGVTLVGDDVAYAGKVTGTGEVGVASIGSKKGEVEWFHPVGSVGKDVVHIRAAQGERILAEVEPDLAGDSGSGSGSGGGGGGGAVGNSVDNGGNDGGTGGKTRAVRIDAGQHPVASGMPRTDWTLSDATPIGFSGSAALVRRVTGIWGSQEDHGVALIDAGDESTVVWDSETDRPGDVADSAMVAGGLLFVNWADGAEYRNGDTGELLGTVGKHLSDCTAVDSAAGGSATSVVLCAAPTGTDPSRMASPILFDTTGMKGGAAAAGPAESGTGAASKGATGGVEVRQLRNRQSNEIFAGLGDRFVIDSPDLDHPTLYDPENFDQITVDAWGRTVDANVRGMLTTVNDAGQGLFLTCRADECTWKASWEVRPVGR